MSRSVWSGSPPTCRAGSGGPRHTCQGAELTALSGSIRAEHIDLRARTLRRVVHTYDADTAALIRRIARGADQTGQARNSEISAKPLKPVTQCSRNFGHSSIPQRLRKARFTDHGTKLPAMKNLYTCACKKPLMALRVCHALRFCRASEILCLRLRPATKVHRVEPTRTKGLSREMPKALRGDINSKGNSLFISKHERCVVHVLARSGAIHFEHMTSSKGRGISCPMRDGHVLADCALKLFDQLKKQRFIKSKNGRPDRATWRGMRSVNPQSDNQ